MTTQAVSVSATSVLPSNPSTRPLKVAAEHSIFNRMAITIIGATAAIALSLHVDIAAVFQFDRSAVAAGEVWRLATGHLTHWTLDHFLWDFVAFIALGAYCEANHRRLFVATLVVSAIAISGGIWIMRSDVQLYRGLSGIDSALYVLAAAIYGAESRRDHDRCGMLAAAAAVAGFLLKIGYELASGATLFVDSAAAGFEPLPLAHLLGAAGAVTTLVLQPLFTRRCLSRAETVRAVEELAPIGQAR